MSLVACKNVGIGKYCDTAMDPSIFYLMLKHRMANGNIWRKECANTIYSYY
jgi:hypothetical protein